MVANKLIKSLSKLIWEFKLAILELKAKIVMSLFRSYALWSDRLLLEPTKDSASHITNMLEQTSFIKSEDSK